MQCKQRRRCLLLCCCPDVPFPRRFRRLHLQRRLLALLSWRLAAAAASRGTMHVIHRPAVFLFFSTPIMCASRGLDGFLPAEFRAVPAGRRDASYHMARRRRVLSHLICGPAKLKRLKPCRRETCGRAHGCLARLVGVKLCSPRMTHDRAPGLVVSCV